MSLSPRLSLPYLAPAQSQKHVTVNEALRRLDAVVQLSVASRSASAEPGAPAEGDAYILPAGKTGAAWGAMVDGALAAFQDGAWVEIAPDAGWRAWVADEGTLLFHDGAAWTAAARWGVNTPADATNKLAVRSNAVLFDALDAAEGGTGDAQVKVNKEAAGDTASHLFQTGFSGRAEFGLTGDDDFHLKVSANGAAWTEALVIDKDTGYVGIGQTAPTTKLNVTGDPNVIYDLTGDVDFDKDGNFLLFMLSAYSSDANHSPFSVQRKARGTKAAPAAVALGDRLGGFSFRGYSPAGIWVQNGLIDSLVDAAPSGSSVPGALLFRTGSSGVSERMRITSGGDVGIGTSSPAAKLDVNGPVKVKSYAKAALPSASAGAGQMIYVSDEVGGAVIAFSDGASWRRVTDRAVVA